MKGDCVRALRVVSLTIVISEICYQSIGLRTVFYRVSDSSSYLLLLKSISVTPTTTTTQCGHLCDQDKTLCKVFAINKNKDCLFLDGTDFLSTSIWVRPDRDWVVYYRESAIIQMPIFRASSDGGAPIYNSWNSGKTSALTRDQATKVLDLTTPMATVYKHPLIENWESWDIREVIVSLYTDAKEVANISFKGVETNSLSWFSHSNLISSPWADLNNGAIPNFFGISSDSPARIFYINSIYNFCPGDAGWFVVIDEADNCNWTKYSSYPRFKYAVGDSCDVWSNGNFAEADDLAISILYRP